MAADTDPTTDQDAPSTPLLDEVFDSPAGAAGESTLRWHTLGRGDPVTAEAAPVTRRRLLTQLTVGVLAVLVLVGFTGAYAAQRLAERESVNDAAARANLLAEAVVTPALTAGLAAGKPVAIAKFDQVIRHQVLAEDVVRVKVWSADGTVLYADEPQLIGRKFPFDEEQRAALDERATHAEVSTLDASENAFEKGTRLVEVYRPIWFPDGKAGLFEIYTSYDAVGARTTELWRGFAGITLSSLMVLLLLLAPILWHLLKRLRGYERQRAAWLEHAVEASTAERRRIAGTLHDGPVQELAAASFAVAGAASSARRAGQADLATELDAAATSVRGGIRALRGLVTDIHPAALLEDGLASALGDLAEQVSGPDLRIDIDVDEAAVSALGQEQQRAMFRLAQESLRNCAKHAGPANVSIRLRREADEVVLDVIDDGRGFDLPATLAAPEHGHLGLQVLADLATAPGMQAAVATAPGSGTHWRFTQEVSR